MYDTIDDIIAAAGKVGEKRAAAIAEAIALGAPMEVLARLVDAARLARADAIKLDTRYGGLSRGKAWARSGSGGGVTWGERLDGGVVRVGPGEWLVYSSDGFKRDERIKWHVEHVQVGQETWTIAD